MVRPSQNRQYTNSTRVGKSSTARSHTRQNDVQKRAAAAIHKGSAKANDAAWGILGSLADAVRNSRIALVALIVAALVIFGALFDFIGNNGKAFAGVRVGGLDVSGMNAEQIQNAAMSEFSTRIGSAEVTIYANEQAMASRTTGMQEHYGDEVTVEEERANRVAWSTDASSLQAYIDYAKLAEDALAVGREGPLDRFGLFFGGRDIDIPVNFNEAIIDSLANQIDLSIGKPLLNYGVEIVEGVGTVTPGYDGDMIDREEFKLQIAQQLLSTDTEHRAFVATTKHTPVQISESSAKATADTITKAIASGITFSCEGKNWHADAPLLGTWIQTALTQDDQGGYQLLPSFSLQMARSDVLSNIQPSFESGQGHVRFSRSGEDTYVSVTSAGTFPLVAEAIENLNIVLFSNSGATFDGISTPANAPVEVLMKTAQIPEKMTLSEALTYGVVTPISEYTTEYTTGAVERNTNIHLASDLIDNSIISADGGVWSFNDTAGECNEEKGFQEAHAIAGNTYIDEIGGGICQVATTVFNAVYEAGYPITERHNHSFYIASYPQGRDAAISWPSPDLKWQNDSPSDLLLDLSYTDSTVTATLYGEDRGYVVESEEGEWVEGTPFSTVYEEDSSILQGVEYVKSTGENGHSITVTRTVKDADGNVVRSDVFSSVYSPQNTVIVRGTGSYDTMYDTTQATGTTA